MCTTIQKSSGQGRALRNIFQWVKPVKQNNKEKTTFLIVPALIASTTHFFENGKSAAFIGYIIYFWIFSEAFLVFLAD